MNRIIVPRRSHGTTQAAEGFPRLKWTLEEFERLSELGFFGGIDSERERIELVDGELVPMNAKGARHELVRDEILNYFMRRLPNDVRLRSEPGWRPGGDVYLEPEMILCPEGFSPTTVPASEVLLLIEVADTSLRYDESVKARIYARHGVREYWVVNARTLETHVHRDPTPKGYRSIVSVGPTDTLTPHLLPALAVSLGRLGIES
jgi:Uma2 family endonuclease